MMTIGSGPMAWPEGSGQRNAVLLCLSIVVAVALANRFYFLLDRGGLALDQQAWAADRFFGGITNYYLKIRDAMLAGKAESKPWAYLPGYPLFLAALHLIGIKDLAFVRLAQTAIDSLAILPLYFVLFRLGKSAYLAIFGCLLYAVAPWWSVGSTYLLAEALTPAMVILLLAAMTLIREHAARNVNWCLLGLSASVLPFFRSEMVLLFGPLAAWAVLVAPKHKRISAMFCVVAGFVFPLMVWALRNYYFHGQFMLAPPAKWYAAWAGLGQISNGYGYFLSDVNAVKLLASKGIEYHSLDAEKYWFNEYLGAWINHPGHVIRTILFRLEQILTRTDNEGISVSGFVSKAYRSMAFITPIMLIWLLRKRRAADAFLIAWPMLYAVATLGFLYVERRYVRYAGLTYLLALPVILGMCADMVCAMWPRRWSLVTARQALSGIAAVGSIALVYGVANQFVHTRDVAYAQAVADRSDVKASLKPTSVLADVAFRPVVPGVLVSHGEDGLDLQANSRTGTYLLMAPIEARRNVLAIVRYRATLRRGGIGFGVLSANKTQWLAHRTLFGEAGRAIEGVFASPVQVGSSFVIDAQDANPGVDVLVSQLEWTLACPSSTFDLFSLFVSKTMIELSDCSGAQ